MSEKINKVPVILSEMPSKNLQSRVETFRKEIDLINEAIFNLIAKRVEVTRSIAYFKKEQNLPLEDLERENVQFEYLKKLGENHNLEPAAIEEIFSLIIECCKTKMKEVM